MKWSNCVWFLWGAIILSSILFWMGTQDKQSVEYDKHNTDTIDSLQKKIFFAKEALLNQVLSTEENMPELSEYMSDSLEIKNKPILLYRYSSTMCEACTNMDLNILQEYLPKIGKDKILILPAFGKDRDSRIKMRSVLSGFNYHNIEKEKIPIPLNMDLIPHRFFAILDSCNQIRCIYYPSKNFSDMTYMYLDFLLDELDD